MQKNVFSAATILLPSKKDSLPRSSGLHSDAAAVYRRKCILRPRIRSVKAL